MPICPLPKETVRLLGSPLTFPTPVAVVKELVDNALDAGATSVEVLISANTIDSVEVRDNGHGIHPADFDSIGHRGCTSKLRNFDDIRIVGGTTLGFRGDALACAAHLSTLVITTRTDEEATASKLYFSEKGGVTKKERAAGPVGTAVKVTDLFARLPVRKQVALNESAKTLSSIRELLHSYAFARPHVRLTFKVINRSKAGWSYSPGPHGNIKQAAFQVFGPDLVSQCVEKSNKPVQHATSVISKTQGKGGYTIDALLPKPGADLAKISKGAWFSVDARPVSSSKGTIKTLYAAFKARLKTQLDSGGASALKHPFLAVNIGCPSESYDPNVEPAKDEVLFANSPDLTEVFDRFLDEEYPITPPASRSPETEVNPPPTTVPSKQPAEATASPERGPHTLSPVKESAKALSTAHAPGTITSIGGWVRGLMGIGRPEPQQPPDSPRMTASDIQKMEQASQVSAYKSPPSSGNQEAVHVPELHASVVPTPVDDRTDPTDRGWKVNLSSQVDEEEIQSTAGPLAKNRDEEPRLDPEDGPAKSLQGVNPWVIAKFNAARNRQADLAPQPAQETRLTQTHEPPTVLETDSQRGQRALGMRLVRLDTEGSSRQQLSGPVPANGLPSLRVPGGAYRPPFASSRASESRGTQEVELQVSNRRGNRNTLPSFPPSNEAARQSGGGPRKKSAQDEQDSNWFQGSLDFTGRGNKRRRRDKGDVDREREALAATAMQQEPDDGLDFGAIRRRQMLAENHRAREPFAGWLESSDLEGAGETMPRIEAAVQPPQGQPEMPKAKGGDKTGLPPGDARAYLVRKECSLPATTPRKLRRVKSSMLPLETTPAGEETTNLMQTVHLAMQELCQTVERYHALHPAGETADSALVGHMDENDLRDMCDRVKELLSERGWEAHGGCQVEFNMPQAA